MGKDWINTYFAEYTPNFFSKLTKEETAFYSKLLTKKSEKFQR